MTVFTGENKFNFCCDYKATKAFDKFCKPQDSCEYCLEKFALKDSEYDTDFENKEISTLSGTCLFLFFEEQHDN